jgi:hypothetical protein
MLATALPPATPPACPREGCPHQLHGARKFVSWAAQIVVVLILAQTLFFKFTYAPETRFIFEERGGRAGATLIGLAELACVVLLLIPRCASVGALFSLGVIGGAIFTHLTALGIEVKNPDTGVGDGGLLFGLAVIVAMSSLVVLALRWKQLPYIDRVLKRVGIVV